MASPSDPSRCPLCGAANACGMASGASDASGCWCTKVEIAEEVVARMPDAARGVACVCEKCAIASGSERRASRPLKTVGTRG